MPMKVVFIAVVQDSLSLAVEYFYSNLNIFFFPFNVYQKYWNGSHIISLIISSCIQSKDN